MGMEAPASAPETVLRKYYQEGLYTHAWGAVFSIDKPEVPYPHWSISADDADIFDYASLTKALVTGPLVVRDCLSGRVSLQSSVGDWFGAYGRSSGLPRELDRLTISALLNHSSGLPAWQNFWIINPNFWTQSPMLHGQHMEEIREYMRTGLVRSVSRIGPPVQRYSDIGYILLGYCIESLHAAPYDEIFAEFLNKEIGYDGISGRPTFVQAGSPLQERCIPTGFCRLRNRLLRGEVHDENCASFLGVAGHAGLFGSGPTLVCYLRTLFASPLGRAYFDLNAARRQDPAQAPKPEGLLGLRQAADPSSEVFGSGWAMGHMGFTGVAFWIDPQTWSCAVLLTNRVIGGRMRPGIASARREFFSACQGLN